MKRSILASLLLAAGGCTSFLPLQTASTVPVDSWQFSAQASGSPWCSFTSNPDNCHVRPQALLIPELRLGARRGLLDGLDVGASVHGQVLTSDMRSSVDVGLLADVKKELWSRSLGEGRRQIVSVGLGAGINALTNETNTVGQADAVLPVFFGHQTLGEEYFASVRAANRLTFGYEPAAGPVDVVYFGTSVGMVWRRTGIGVQLSYDAPVVLANRGAITISTGFLWSP